MIYQAIRSFGRGLLRTTFWGLFVLLVLLALYVSLGRQLTPMVSNYRESIEDALSEALDAHVQIGAIEGEWRRFSPRFELSGLQIGARVSPTDIQDDLQPALSLNKLTVAADIPNSLLQRKLVIANGEVSSLDLRLEQQTDGRWTLSGLALNNAQPPDVVTVFRWLTGLNRVVVVESKLEFTPQQGDTLLLSDLRADFQSQGGRHALLLSGRPDVATDRLSVQVDLSGSELTNLDGRIYVDAPPAEYAGLLASLLRRAVQIDRLRLSSLQVFGEFWMSLSQGQLESLTWQGGGHSELQVLDQTQQDVVDLVTVDNAKVNWLQLQAPDDTEGWRLYAEGLDFDYDGGDWPAGGLTAEWVPDRLLNLHLDAVDIGLVSRLTSALLPGSAIDTELNAFNARGILRNTILSAQLEQSNLVSARLTTAVEGGAISAHRRVPAFWGVDAYAELDYDAVAATLQGFAEVASDDFSMHIPELFDDIWHYDHANGRVRVHADMSDDLHLRLSSSVIDIDSPIIGARGQFALDVQTGADRQIELELMIGALHADARYKSQYLPMAPGAPRSAQGVLQWVDSAVLGGQGGGSGFVFRGRVQGGSAPVERTVQMFYRVENGELKFDSQWPALEAVSGVVVVSDGEVDVAADGGRSLDIDFRHTVATVRANPGGGSWLTVSGTGAGSASQGLTYLQQTPVTRDIGQYMSDWQVSGQTQFTLSLAVPLFIENETPDVALAVDFTDHALSIPEYALEATRLNGRLLFQADSGLASADMQADVFGQPVTINLSSPRDGGGQLTTRVEVAGRTDMEALRSWQGLPGIVAPLLSQAEGAFDYKVLVDLGSAPQLQISSSLEGVALELPAPFSKQAIDLQPLFISMGLGDSRRLQMRLENRLQMDLMLADDVSNTSGLIYLGEPADGMRVRRLNPNAPGVEILGQVAELDVQAWQQAVQRMIVSTAGADGVDSGAAEYGLAELRAQYGVTVSSLNAFGEIFPDVTVSGNLNAGLWTVITTSDDVSGELRIPAEAGAPWVARIEHLHLRRDQAPDEADNADLEASNLLTQELDLEELPTVEYELPREDPLQAVDPRVFPTLDLQADELTVAGADFGAWSFRVESDAAGALFSDVQASVRGVNIGSPEEPAEFRWIYDGDQHRSVLNGIVSAGDLATVLSAFGYAPSIESRSARLDARLHWDGSPAFFSALGLNGDIDLQVTNGRFRQRAGVANSALRLISVINFDALVRRLRFSDDLARAGLSYDEIRGRVNLSEGIVAIEDRLQIIGSASLFQLAGTVDLAGQTIDGDLYVTLPVSDNIPWLSGLAVLNNLINWQLAVGVFLFDQIFGNQVDNLTSAHYRLEGPWEGLEPRLYQVFSGAERNTQRTGNESNP